MSSRTRCGGAGELRESGGIGHEFIECTIWSRSLEAHYRPQSSRSLGDGTRTRKATWRALIESNGHSTDFAKLGTEQRAQALLTVGNSSSQKSLPQSAVDTSPISPPVSSQPVSEAEAPPVASPPEASRSLTFLRILFVVLKKLFTVLDTFSGNTGRFSHISFPSWHLSLFL